MGLGGSQTSVNSIALKNSNALLFVLFFGACFSPFF